MSKLFVAAVIVPVTVTSPLKVVTLVYPVVTMLKFFTMHVPVVWVVAHAPAAWS